MRKNSIKYHLLKALARGETPMTCEEAWELLPEANRPEPVPDDSKVWANLTSHATSLYGEHYVDRRKRDVKWKPFEYWLAAKGREELQENGDLPEDYEGGTVPVPENPDADEETTAEEANPSAIRTDLGLDDPDVDTGDALTEALSGIVEKVGDVERGIDNLRETAVTEAEVEARLQNSGGDGLRQQVDALKQQVNALAEAQSRRENLGGDFEPFIRRLRELEQDGYGLYEGEITTDYGGNVQGVRVKAKPKGKTDKKGPQDSDGERVTVKKDGSADE